MENPTDRGAWQATVLGDSKSLTWPSDFHFHYYMPAMALNAYLLTHLFFSPHFLILILMSLIKVKSLIHISVPVSALILIRI